MSYKVLIVDDSKLARMSIIKILAGSHPDWPRLEAGNAAEAVNATRDSAPDIALLDFNMPVRDGLDLAVELRKLKPSMSIAVISANHQQEVVNRARAIGAAFLPKPVSEEAMSSFLDSAVHNLKSATP